MPVMPISDGNGGILLFAPARVSSLMLFPSDDTASAKHRKAYMAVHVAEAALGKEKRPASFITVNRQFFEDLLNSPSREEVWERSKRHSQAGMLAGFLITTITSLHPLRPSDASVLKAVEIVSQLLEGRDVPSSPAYILRQWGVYKPVAHLWAAFLRMRILTPGFDHEEASLEAFADFLGLSEFFRQQGEGIVARGQAQKHGPVLDPARTFKVPADLLPFDAVWEFIPGPPSQAIIEILTNYRAPKKL